MLYLFFFKPLRDHLRGFLIAAWAGDKIAEFSFPEISFHFPLRPGTESPPRMRGKAALCVAFSIAPGITPAYAGKSDPNKPFSG